MEPDDDNIDEDLSDMAEVYPVKSSIQITSPNAFQ